MSTSKPELSLTDRAARVLRAEAEQTRVTSDDRNASINAITMAMRQRKRRRGIRFGIIASTAVAASIALVVGLSSRSHQPPVVASAAVPAATSVPTTPTPTPTIPPTASFIAGTPSVVRGDKTLALSDGVELAEGDRVVVEPGSRATVALQKGTHVVVEDHGEVQLASSGAHTAFLLRSGTVRADVAKLKQGERFVIRTTDAEVEVQGTSFDVTKAEADPGCGNGTTTRVRVREGVVVVRVADSETFVRAGESWPTGCEKPSAAPPTAPVVSAAAAAPPAVRKPASSSDLAAQNDLYDAALSKKRAGDARGAVASFEDLLARYPSTHLAQSARAERMKLLRAIDGERSKAAARDYLKRYPAGFARSDADLILAN